MQELWCVNQSGSWLSIESTPNGVMRRMKGRNNLQGCGQEQGKPGRDGKVLLGVIITPRPEETAVREGHL